MAVWVHETRFFFVFRFEIKERMAVWVQAFTMLPCLRNSTVKTFSPYGKISKS